MRACIDGSLVEVIVDLRARISLTTRAAAVRGRHPRYDSVEKLEFSDQSRLGRPLRRPEKLWLGDPACNGGSRPGGLRGGAAHSFGVTPSKRSDEAVFW